MSDAKNRLVLVEFPEDVARLDAAGWLRGESVQRICLAPAPAVKLEALESVLPPKLRSGRFKATDKLIASLTADLPSYAGQKPRK